MSFKDFFCLVAFDNLSRKQFYVKHRRTSRTFSYVALRLLLLGFNDFNVIS